jgi:hypothetical protein
MVVQIPGSDAATGQGLEFRGERRRLRKQPFEFCLGKRVAEQAQRLVQAHPVK